MTNVDEKLKQGNSSLDRGSLGRRGRGGSSRNGGLLLFAADGRSDDGGGVAGAHGGVEEAEAVFDFIFGGEEKSELSSFPSQFSPSEIKRRKTHQVKSEVSTTASPILVRLKEKGIWLEEEKRRKKK